MSLCAMRAAARWAVPLIMAASVAWATTVGFGSELSWFDEQRIAMLVVLGIALVVMSVDRPPPDAYGWPSAAVAAVLALGVLSALVAPRRDAALAEWAAVAAIWLFALGSGLGRRDVERAGAMVSAIVATAYVTGVVANYASALAVGFPVGSETLIVGFSNPRFPAQLQALTLPLFPLAWAQSERPIVRAPLAAVWALWWMCLLGSGSRTGWLAMVAASAVVAACGREGGRWLRLQALFAAAGATLFWLGFFVIPDVFGVESAVETGRLSATGSIHARLALWQSAIDMARQHPVLGVGPMHFAYRYNGLGAHPHNWWLQIAAEWGIPALAGFAFASMAAGRGLIRAMRASMDRGDRRQSAAIVAAIGALTAWTVGILFDGYMVIPTTQLLSAMVLALAFALSEPVAWTRCLSALQRPLAWMQRGLALTALVVMASLPWSSLGSPAAREAAWMRAYPGEVLSPRLWSQGWIGPDRDPCAIRRACGCRAEEAVSSR